MKKKLIIVAFSVVSTVGCNKKVEDTTCKEYENRIDLLQNELTTVGGKLDSMILEHDYGFTFTN